MNQLTADAVCLAVLCAGSILGLNTTNGTLAGSPNAILPLDSLNGTSNCTALGNGTFELLNGTLVDNTTGAIPTECLNVTVLPPVLADSLNLTNTSAGNISTPGTAGVAGTPGVGGLQSTLDNVTRQINAGLQGVNQLPESVRAGINERLANILPGFGAAGGPGGK